MKVLVTGGTGYLGGHLVQALQQSGYVVRVLVRPTSNVVLLPPQVELAYGDLLNVQSLIRACEGCDAIIHTAAAVDSWLPNASQFHIVNVGGLKNIIQAVESSRSIKKMVYTSSFFALGPNDSHGISDENKVHSRKHYCSEYERSKVESDEIAREAAKNLPVVIVYPGVIYGPGKLTRGNIVTELLVEHLNGWLPGFIGYGEGIFSFSHVEDVAFGHIAALEKGASGERYLLGGENASFLDVFRIVANLKGSPEPQWHIPLWVLHICGYLLEFWARISQQPPLITTAAVQVLKRKWAYTSAKAMDELGYKPRPLQEGLAQLLIYLTDEGLIKK